MPIGIGLLGLGTVGAGVAEILLSPQGRHPLVADLELRQVAVRDLNRPRPIPLSNNLLTTDPAAVVANPDVDLVVEVMGGLEPARSLILAAIEAGKAVVTANKALIADCLPELDAVVAGLNAGAEPPVQFGYEVCAGAPPRRSEPAAPRPRLGLASTWPCLHLAAQGKPPYADLALFGTYGNRAVRLRQQQGRIYLEDGTWATKLLPTVAS